MKIFAFLIALIGLTNSLGWQLSDVGLCIERPSNCPSRLQKYGICCVLNNTPTEFKNYCQACAAVKMYLFRVVWNGNISFQQEMYVNEDKTVFD